MALLSRSALLKKDSLKIEKVTLGKDHVFVRQMTGQEKNNFEQSMLKKVENEDGETTFETTIDNFKAKLAVNVLCDAQGELLLKPSDYEILAQSITAQKLETIVTAAQKLNAITPKAKEDKIKN